MQLFGECRLFAIGFFSSYDMWQKKLKVPRVQRYRI